VVNIQQWIDKKETPTAEVKEPAFFKELNPRQQERIVQMVTRTLKERNEPINKENIFDVIEIIGKEQILSILNG
jgi:hypothetical protein